MLMELMVLGAFLMIVLGAIAWALWPRRRPAPRAHAGHGGASIARTPQPCVGAHRALAGLVAAAVNGVEDMRSTYRQVRETGRADDSAMSSDDDGDLIDNDTIPHDRAWNREQGTGNRQEHDPPLGPGRLAGVAALARQGLDDETIAGVQARDRAALVAALKVVPGGVVRAVMRGKTAENTAILRDIKEVRDDRSA